MTVSYFIWSSAQSKAIMIIIDISRPRALQLFLVSNANGKRNVTYFAGRQECEAVLRVEM